MARDETQETKSKSVEQSLAGKNYFSSFSKGADATNNLANSAGLYIDIYSTAAKARVAFKAFLKEFTENFDVKLESEQDADGVTLQHNKGVTREISISIAIPAFSVDEAKMNLRNVNLLTQMMHPTGIIDTNGNVTSNDIQTQTFKIRFLNLIVGADARHDAIGSAFSSGLDGYIDNLKYTFVSDDEGGGFLADRGRGRKTFDGFVYPKLISLQFNFYPTFIEPPVWDKTKFSLKNYPYGYKGVKNRGGKDILESSDVDAIGDGVNETDTARINRALNRRRRR